MGRRISAPSSRAQSSNISSDSSARAEAIGVVVSLACVIATGPFIKAERLPVAALGRFPLVSPPPYHREVRAGQYVAVGEPLGVVKLLGGPRAGAEADVVAAIAQ